MPPRVRDAVPVAVLTLTALGLLIGVATRSAAATLPAGRAVVPATVQRLIAVAPRERLATWLTHPSVPSATAGRVVLLPGTLGSVYSMRHVSSQLAAAGYTVLVIDALGMGASDRPLDADYSLGKQARRVVAVLDSVGWPSVRMAAHGTSATIAFHVAAQAPERVSHIVSIAGGPVSSQRTGGVESAMRVSGLLDNRIGRALARRMFSAQLRERSGDDTWVTDAAVEAYLEPLMRDLSGTLRVLKQMGAAEETTTLAHVLKSIRATVLLLVGDAVTAGSPTDAQTELLRSSVSQARIETIAGSGTMLHEEQPTAVVNAIRGIALADHSVRSEHRL